MKIQQFNKIPKAKYDTQEIYVKSIENTFDVITIMIVNSAVTQRVSGYDFSM